jgi:hypothetical protein
MNSNNYLSFAGIPKMQNFQSQISQSSIDSKNFGLEVFTEKVI